MDENTVLDPAEEVQTNAGGKKKFLDYLPLILVGATALLSLVFAFVVGFTTTVTAGGETQKQSQLLYYYFYKAYADLKALSLDKTVSSAIKTAYIVTTVFTAGGLVLVVTAFGFTAYHAIKKFVLKKEAKVEFYAKATYFAYLLFALSFYALNNGVCSDGTNKTVSTLNIATVVGLALTTAAFVAYFVVQTVLEKHRLRVKANRVNFIYSLVRVALLALTIVMVFVMSGGASFGVKATGTQYIDGTTKPIVLFEKAPYYYGGGAIKFISLATTGVLHENVALDNIGSLITSSVISFAVGYALAVVCCLLVLKSLSSLYHSKQNDTVFVGIALAAAAFYLYFSVVATGFMAEVAFGSDVNKYLSYLEEVEVVVSGKTTTYQWTKDSNVEFKVKIVALYQFVVPILSVAASALALLMSALRTKIVTAATRQAAKEKAEKDEVILEVKNLCKHFVVGNDFFGRPNAYLKAVDNVSFSIKKGETLGIVGESGCGKTTMGRTLLRLYDVTSGEVWFEGKEISSLTDDEFDKLRPDMQMIFQDPYASLSPRLTVGEIIGEAARYYGIVDKAHYQDYIMEVMKMCGLQPHYFERYPHEFSGGQRQRICIARALALKPKLVVCDEPVSALDVSIQAQIINMLIELRKSLGLTYIFISHDLSVVKHISDAVGVMYLGSLVEYGSKKDIFSHTLHPYTQALFSAVPVPNPHVKMNRVILKGDIPSPVNPPAGCKFHTRCEKCMGICEKVVPAYKEVEPGHFCACHLYNTPEEEAELLAQAEKEAALLAQAQAEESK